MGGYVNGGKGGRDDLDRLEFWRDEYCDRLGREEGAWSPKRDGALLVWREWLQFRVTSVLWRQGYLELRIFK